MERLTIDEIALYSNADIISRIEGVDFVDNVELDSRNVDENSLFVAVKGEKQDGHIFLRSAYDNGCRNFLVSDSSYLDGLNANVFLVEDTEISLGKLSKGYRERFDIPFVAVTGSVGKTTTRNMVYAVLSSKYDTLKNERNLNNQFGVPLTLFNLNRDHECAVIEMGMSGFGEIDYLANIVRPDIAIISNIGTSHIECLGSREGILKAKTEIVNYFDADSTLILNGEDDMLDSYYSKNIDGDFHIYRFGKSEKMDIYYRNIAILENNKTKFAVVYNGVEEEYTIPTIGEHNVSNAVSAILAGHIMGLEYDSIKKGLEKFKQTGDRQKIIDTGEITVINDVYNASPDSMIAALGVLSNYKNNRVAIFGDCLEMGEYGESGHRRVGYEMLGKADVIITTGDNAKYIGIEAERCGFDKNKIHHFDTKNELISNLKTLIFKGDTVLVKASRGCHFEDIVERLEGGFKC